MILVHTAISACCSSYQACEYEDTSRYMATTSPSTEPVTQLPYSTFQHTQLPSSFPLWTLTNQHACIRAEEVRPQKRPPSWLYIFQRQPRSSNSPPHSTPTTRHLTIRTLFPLVEFQNSYLRRAVAMHRDVHADLPEQPPTLSRSTSKWYR